LTGAGLPSAACVPAGAGPGCRVEVPRSGCGPCEALAGAAAGEALAGGGGAVGGAVKSRLMIATVPPFRKKSSTAYVIGLSPIRPPNLSVNSSNELTVTALSVGPHRVRPRNTVTDVGTPMIVCDPLGTSCR
jgi:hypothetical protein